MYHSNHCRCVRKWKGERREKKREKNGLGSRWDVSVSHTASHYYVDGKEIRSGSIENLSA